MLLEKYRQAARSAHYQTSFRHEERGDSMIKDYSEQLKSDLEEVEKLGGNPADYQTRYERHFSAWIAAKSRCFSSMITGPAKFPTRKAEKANQSEHNHFTAFDQFREKYFDRLRRNKRREERAQIDPVAEMRANIEKAEKSQEKMKAVNKIVQNKKLSDAEKVEKIAVKLNISEQKAAALLQPDFCGRIGFPAYMLTNNLSNIRRMRDRLAELEKRAAAETKETERPDGIKVVENASADRLQIFFPSKPDAETIQRLKRNAWKWSPSNGCWQRQLTANAKRNVREVLPK